MLKKTTFSIAEKTPNKRRRYLGKNFGTRITAEFNQHYNFDANFVAEQCTTTRNELVASKRM